MDGSSDGSIKGPSDGSHEGTSHGSSDGSDEGPLDGWDEGTSDGSSDGSDEGSSDGSDHVICLGLAKRTCKKDLQKGLAKRTNSISFLVCMSSIALSMNAMVLALSMNNNICSKSLL